jgi:hypothetical protein
MEDAWSHVQRRSWANRAENDNLMRNNTGQKGGWSGGQLQNNVHMVKYQKQELVK